MLQNAYLLAKIGADTAENEQHFAEILPTDAAAAIRRCLLESCALLWTQCSQAQPLAGRAS